MKVIPQEKLIIRDSFKLPFSGGEIWSEELDGLNIYTDLVIEKFLKDMTIIKKPSSPGLIAVHLNETLVEGNLIDITITEFIKAKQAVNKVAFIGLDNFAKKLMKSKLEKENVLFSYSFHKDYEKAKEWLINGKYAF